MKGARPLTDREVLDVSQSFSGKYASRDKALFLLGTKTGFRVSELLSLQVQDISQHGKVADRMSVRRAHMKGKGEGRTIGLNPEAKSALHAWITEAQLTSGPLFPSQKAPSKPITSVQAWRILDAAYEANGLTGQLGTHTMRKTFAGKAYTLLNHDLVNTQRALGHKNINSTVSYLSFNDTVINDAIMRL